MLAAALETKIIDTDSHVLEPPDLWTSRVPARWKDEAPRTVIDPKSGYEKWLVAGQLTQGAGTSASADWKDFWPSRPPTFAEATVGAWNPAARLRWLDKVGVYAEVLYPNILGFHMWAFMKMDSDIRLACVRAYNDYQTDFCSEDPKRLLAIAYLPWWDIEASIAELHRCVEMGHRGVNFGSEFEKMGFPPLRDDHWHRLLRAIEEAGVPISFHIGFNSRSEETVRSVFGLQDTLDIAQRSAVMFLGNSACIAELIMGGICHNFPTLKFVSVESGFGYVPFLLEALDWQFVNFGGRVTYPGRLLPSEYFRRQIYATFWFEKYITRQIDLYQDNVMFETDYPHGTSLSPAANTFAKGARDTVVDNLQELPDDILRKILWDNAALLYRID